MGVNTLHFDLFFGPKMGHFGRPGGHFLAKNGSKKGSILGPLFGPLPSREIHEERGFGPKVVKKGVQKGVKNGSKMALFLAKKWSFWRTPF